jgi:tetratricopeptide (TPR) repeat protein
MGVAVEKLEQGGRDDNGLSIDCPGINRRNAYKQAAYQHLKGNYVGALEILFPLIDLDSRGTEVLDLAAACCFGAGRMSDAVTLYKRLVERESTDARSHYHLGVALQLLSRLPEAEAAYRDAISLRPFYGEAHCNLGTIMYAQDRLDEAQVEYRQALGNGPQQASAYFNLGSVLFRLQRHDEAESAFRQAIAIRPDCSPIKYSFGTLLMAMGRFDEALPLLEQRYRGSLVDWAEFRQQPVIRPVWHIRQWQGEPLDDARLLILAEQGIGDAIQFVRYIPALKARGASRITVTCSRALRPLFSSVDCIDKLIDPEADQVVFADYDFWCFMMSLPFHSRTTLDTIPASVPYVGSPAKTRLRFERRIRDALPAARLKVGLVWAGNPRLNDGAAKELDRRRSLRASSYRPLLEVPGISFVSLQVGKTTQPQIYELPVDLRPLDLMGEVRDLSETAAIIECLDLVITVDTSVAHLAGALNKPVWILSRFDACWRWLYGRDDSPWYPSARLFRQKNPGDWDEVIERVRRALVHFVSDEPGCSGA